MKVVFLSTFALDANVSLINALKNKCDIYFFTEALYEINNFLDKEKLSKIISKGTEVEDLQLFREFIPLDKTFVIKGTRNLNILKKIYISFKINQYLKSINPDVIVIDNYMLTYFVSTLSYHKKMFLIVHDPFLHSGENFIVDRFLRKLHFKLIDNKILLNENQKDAFVKHYKYNPEDINTSFLSIYEYLRYYKTVNLNISTSFNILFFGRISPYKGLKFLLDAFADIINTKNYTDISLTIAGSGSFNFDITEFNKYPQIKIINEYINPNKLADLISESSVVICPYTDATQSGVVMSAFALKKPVIVTNVGGLPEMVTDRETGIIIEAKSSTEISKAILELYKDRVLLEKMSGNIEKIYFWGEKSWENSANKLLKAFSKIKK